MVFYSVLSILFGAFLIAFAVQIYNVIGVVPTLEQRFGDTKTGIQFVGVIIIILTVLVTSGGLNFLLKPLFP